MPVIKSANALSSSPHYTVFDFDDWSAQENTHVEQARQQACAIIKQAEQEAAALRQRHEAEGRAAAEQTVQQRVEQLAGERIRERLQTLLPALEQAIAGIHQARDEWLAQWEKQAVSLAAGIAARLVRRELRQAPEIMLDLLKEALELAAGHGRLRVRVNPLDHEALREGMQGLVNRHAPQGAIELLADPQVSPGGCVVETEHGRIDQNIESQLARIEQELLGA